MTKERKRILTAASLATIAWAALGSVRAADNDLPAPDSCVPPEVIAVGSRYLAITPQPIDGLAPLKLQVSSPDWPCLAKYLGGVLRCAGTGDQCHTTAECNRCSFSGDACLSDLDCQLADEICLISGQLCVPGVVEPFDINNDGIDDGVLADLADDPADAVALTPQEWGASLLRCSKSLGECVADDDCDRGVCIHELCGTRVCNTPCSVIGQDCARFCADFLSHACITDDDCEPGVHCLEPVCVLDEECIPGRVYVTGKDIIPSNFVLEDRGLAFVATTYEVRADCGSALMPDFSLPAAATTWLWSDVDNSGFMNFGDIQLMTLGFQGVYGLGNIVPSSIPGGDIVGNTPCTPEHAVNFTDIQAGVFAFKGQNYMARIDTGVCVGDGSPCSVAYQDCPDATPCTALHDCELPCPP